MLKIENLHVSYGGIKALRGISLEVPDGKIVTLIGANGAGKSTLIKVLTGVHDFQTGEIYMVKNAGGKPELIVNHSPQEAQQNGISTVYQEVNLCPNLTVAENLFIGREPRRFGMIDWRTMNRKSAEVLKNLDIHVAPTQSLDECSLAIQQMIAIARAVDMKCRVLILDEPTSSLDDDEVQKLFVLMRKLRAEGVGIIFVTHFLEQVYEVCDRITVLRNGELVGEYEVESLPRVKLVSKMMGKDFDDLADIKGEYKHEKHLEPLIEAKGLGHAGTIRPFDLTINKGECVLLCGRSGCGKTTLMKMVNRLYEPTSGEIRIFGENIGQTDAVALRRKIGYVIQQVGLFPHMTVEKNIAVVPEILGWDSAQIHDRVTELLELVNLDPKQYRGRYPSQLSGGQQQRVGLARALAAKPSLMLLDEPFGAIDAINRTKLQDELMKIHKRAGLTCMFVTHDVTEALKLGTRIMIMNQGKIQQFDTAKNILEYPANAYVASLLQSVQEGLNFFR